MEIKMLGSGNTAEVYEYGRDKVCKLFKEGYPEAYVRLEFSNARIMNKMGLPVPEAYEITKENGRQGIVYERIYGRTLMEALFQEENKEALFQMFINLHKEILKHQTTELIPYKDFLIGGLKGKGIFNDSLVEKILALPDGNFICHGDFHPGNVILKPDNTAVIIDFMNVCRGSREYDIARTYRLFKEIQEAGRLNGVHVMEAYLGQMGVSYEEIAVWAKMTAEYRRYE